MGSTSSQTKLIRKTKKLEQPVISSKKELQIARNNISALIEGKFDFSAKKLLNKTLLFDTSRVNEELIMKKRIENFPGGNNELYILHKPGINSFSLRREDGQ